MSSTPPSSSFFVYLLEASDKSSTYVGATIDVDRRLRQHNKEISGGAHATAIKVNQGKSWNRVCYVKGFPDWKSALQFEWRWKQLSRKISPSIKPIERRKQALQQLLSLDKSTTAAIPYSEWSEPIQVLYE
jgi:structure-specific endonuclease subunit SLX1